MKKIIAFAGFCTLLFLLTQNANAQSVAINSTGNAPDASSILDLSSSSKGFLIPRISLTSLSDATTIVNPATSLLIYNTNTAVTGGKGYYFNNGTAATPSWIKFVVPDVDGIIKSTTASEVIALDRFPMGEVSMTGNSTATVIASTNTFYKIAGATTFNTDFYNFTNGGTTDRLTYTGAKMKMFHIACTLSISSSATNQTIKAVIYKNGVALTNGVIQTKLGSTGDITSTAIHVMTTLSQNDYLELRVSNMSSAADLTITDMNLFAMGVSMGMD